MIYVVDLRERLKKRPNGHCDRGRYSRERHVRNLGFAHQPSLFAASSNEQPCQRLDALEQPVERQRMYVGDHVRNAILRDLRQTRVSQGARPSTMPGFSKRVNDKDPTKALSPLHQRNTLLRMLVRTPKCLCICRRDSEDIYS